MHESGFFFVHKLTAFQWICLKAASMSLEKTTLSKMEMLPMMDRPRSTTSSSAPTPTKSPTSGVGAVLLYSPRESACKNMR